MSPKATLLLLLLFVVGVATDTETTTKPCTQLEKECNDLCVKEQKKNCDHCKGICSDYYDDYGVIHG